jgi:hypothetical protein
MTWQKVDRQSGTGLTYTAAGITVGRTGLYLCACWWALTAGTGRRIVGVASAALANPTGIGDQDGIQAWTPTNSQVMSRQFVLWFTAGTTVTMFPYQDSGGSQTQAAATIGLSVTRLRK